MHGAYTTHVCRRMHMVVDILIDMHMHIPSHCCIHTFAQMLNMSVCTYIIGSRAPADVWHAIVTIILEVLRQL